MSLAFKTHIPTRHSSIVRQLLHHVLRTYVPAIQKRLIDNNAANSLTVLLHASSGASDTTPWYNDHESRPILSSRIVSSSFKGAPLKVEPCNAKVAVDPPSKIRSRNKEAWRDLFLGSPPAWSWKLPAEQTAHRRSNVRIFIRSNGGFFLFACTIFQCFPASKT